MSPKVSVVVPVYNVAAFLPACLDSICAQTLEDIEIIVVNDGSTDNSLEIAREYAARDGRIKVLTKENRGYGHTMNLGLSQATAPYIGIVESDDCARPEMFETLFNLAVKHDADVVRSNYWNMSQNGTRFDLVDVLNLAGAPYEAMFDSADYPDILRGSPAIWTAIYKAAFLRENSIEFLETPGASFQDTGFALKALTSAQRMVITRKAFLNYRVDNAGSSVKSGAKMYCVCDEYQSLEEHLARNPRRAEAFRSVIPAKKYETYVWNYNRLDIALKPEFMERMSREFAEAKSSGDLRRPAFQDREWGDLMELIENPTALGGRDLAVQYPPEDFKEHQRTRCANGLISRFHMYYLFVRHALRKTRSKVAA
ncbi:glycosyltransferase [Collinsella sp. zg1085]|uniref:glycosyltransferase n=1 Tax=Collinsella sp. zg1085 TaxID=2844380 RepID=UPI001C0E75CC|nr:glycosyltransferase [Collinsella sp. zg1085]QWT17566.1 glycosyltransferase [Collinsella sp. zg1085]